ncbi:NADPH-dependent FMN reductase [Succiniclasticum ruminis]|uniref:NADPH-dependent FMN reductase n=1 Tax=Succiniclasticum ruminis TaxID=40841 RepID=A0A1G6LX25_9FIRM|nr:flavodoxin family protein [Succiniclasticum ruminis]SDC47647.1 NADPH-dependent FMN reductase [Succiniclasticum ruminis]
MDRREFLKVTGAGALTLFLSGCGINAVSGDKKAGAAPSAGSAEAKPGGVSNGKKMKIVVLCGSPHKAGTSALLADKFIEGAQAAGHEVFRFNAAFEDINPCRGCDACGMNGPCVIQDAISAKLIQKLVDCDMVALVTPLYYYGFSAQIKTVIDRFYSRTASIHKKKSMLMATAWNSADITFNALQEHYNTLVRYMEWQDVGRVLGYGCGSRSAIEGSEFPEQAFRIGKSL